MGFRIQVSQGNGPGETWGDRGRPGETRGPTLPTIFANCATCSWEPLTMLNPQLVAGKHSFFGDHESEDIRTIFKKVLETL